MPPSSPVEPSIALSIARMSAPGRESLLWLARSCGPENDAVGHLASACAPRHVSDDDAHRSLVWIKDVARSRKVILPCSPGQRCFSFTETTSRPFLCAAPLRPVAPGPCASDPQPHTNSSCPDGSEPETSSRDTLRTPTNETCNTYDDDAYAS